MKGSLVARRTTSPRQLRTPLGAVGVVIALVGAAFAVVAAPVETAADSAFTYLPATGKNGEFASSGPLATDTPAPGPSATDGPTVTRTPEPSVTPTTLPTPIGGHVGHPEDPGTVIMQLGYYETDQPGGVWEEMNGTPWFTLYGDGTVIAGHEFPNPAQPLFTTRVDPDQIQEWLQELAHGVQVYSLPSDPNALYHPQSLGKPVLGVYINTTGGRGKNVEIAGFQHWERRPPQEHAYRAPVIRLLAFARALEAWNIGNLTEPYDPSEYTLIVQHQNPGLLPDPPEWTGTNVRSIADAAPTAASNYVDRMPAHKPVGKAFGLELISLVVPEAETTWGIYNRAAEFKYGGRPYVIGVRKEIPGESFFLPEVKRRVWYRRDAEDLLRVVLPSGDHWLKVSRVPAPFLGTKPRLGLIEMELAEPTGPPLERRR